MDLKKQCGFQHAAAVIQLLQQELIYNNFSTHTTIVKNSTVPIKYDDNQSGHGTDYNGVNKRL